MLELHVQAAGAPVEWHEASVLAIPFPDAAFDVVLCQLGLQFFSDRPTALREMHRVLVPGGRLALNVFGPLEHFPATYALVQALDRHLDPTASVAKRADQVLGDPEALRTLLADAGFHDVVISTITTPVRFASPREYVRIHWRRRRLRRLLDSSTPSDATL
jgi:ubiquinone/menaquinone biosynthesis C-methylase UbiE